MDRGERADSDSVSSLPSASDLSLAESQPQQSDADLPRCSGRESLDLDLQLSGAKGTGPRLFCGHVPKEVNDDMVRAHFSRWGTVADVYFPRHKKTLKRRPFCFVTFASKEDAERALAESGLEIAGVPIKNLTMVEDRDKYYTNKHASARHALLQALKQLGPSNGATPNGATSAAASAPAASGSSSVPASAAPPPAPPPGLAGMSPEQLSSLATVLALEGVPVEVVLQTLGLPAGLAAALAPPLHDPAAAAGLAPGLGGLDGSGALLAQALASPALSTQTAYELAAARGSLDLRTSFDLGGGGGLGGLASARGSLDLAALQQGLAAAVGLPGGRPSMHAVDSRSTLASASDWSAAPSARTSMDPGALATLPATTSGFLSSAGSLSSLSARLSLDAALQLQHSQQQAALLAAQAQVQAGRLSMAAAYPPPLPPAMPQQSMAAVMHSGFYQAGPATPAPPPPPPSLQPQEVQERLAVALSSGLYGGAPPQLPPTRHSMCEFGGPPPALSPFGDTWAPAQPDLGQQQGTLAGYSTVLRPSIDRAGLPPLPPRSPNQDGRQSGSSSPDALLGLPAWSMGGQRVMA